MLANGMYLGVSRKGAAVADMHTNYMETPIVGSRCKTMHAFEYTDSLNLRMVLCVCKSWFARDVAFQSCSIPNLYGLIVRG